jgi:3alpha(or 20beta)-hydroxysteroid dehydrogenase
MTHFFSLKDKVAVITGGGSGIGLATARRFVRAGAKVVIANRRDSAALADSFGAAYVQTDVAKEDEVRQLMESTVSLHGQIDVLVNNAGFGQVGPTALELTDQTLNQHLQTNLFGVMYGVKHAGPHMPSGSSIINVASLAGLAGVPTYGAYVASKFAVIGLTKTAAIELAPQGIRVNCVCPGTIDTPINQAGGAEAELEVVKTLAPLGRIGQPEEVAALIHFLAASDCAYVTGESIVIDGGWLAGPSIAAFERLSQSPAN